MANKSAEKPYYVYILYHCAPNGIRSDGERDPIGRRTENDDLSLEVIRFVVKRCMVCHRLHLANRCICKLYIAYL